MIVAIVLAVHAYLLLEAWSLAHPRRRGARGRAADLGSLEVTPVDPLRLPEAPAGWRRPRALA